MGLGSGAAGVRGERNGGDVINVSVIGGTSMIVVLFVKLEDGV